MPQIPTDSLHETLPGRRELRRAHDEIASGCGPDRAAALVYIGLDRLESINATYGLETGDAYLYAWSQRLKALVQGNGHAFHIVGSQFVVLMPDLSNDDKIAERATHISRRLIRDAAHAFDIGHRVLDVALSAGVVTMPRDGTDFDELLAKAYAARAAAKRWGANEVVCYSDHDELDARSQLDFVTELSEAAGKGQLRLNYQPIVDLERRTVTSAEALMRWQHPARGLLQPGSFIALAEDTGLISRLGKWCLGEACTEYGRWKASGLSLPHISVNVSPRQLNEYGFVEMADAALERAGIAPTALEIEITENVMVSHPQGSARILRRLKSRGLRIVVDDFGAGYSSLVYLHQFPVDKIKIDQAYVARMLHSRKDRAIITATISLARELGLDVVAEGVETREQMDALRRLGCPTVQGYLLSTPLSPDAFVDWARQPKIPTGS